MKKISTPSLVTLVRELRLHKHDLQILLLMLLKLGGDTRDFALSLPRSTRVDFEEFQQALRTEYHGRLHISAARTKF